MRVRVILVGVLVGLPGCLWAGPTASDVAVFNRYVSGVEARLAWQHRSRNFFLAGVGDGMRLRSGEVVVEQMSPVVGSGALLHHWRGTAFAVGARAEDFERLMRDFGAYPRVYAPEVLAGKVDAVEGDRVMASMRVRQKHVITVVMDTSYDVLFGRVDAERGWSVSRNTRVSEIEGAGTARERVLSGEEEHGFLWRMNTYWSYEERDGGLYLQIESVSLTRGIPRGLGWAVKPFVESVPRESLEFTLRKTCEAVSRK